MTVDSVDLTELEEVLSTIATHVAKIHGRRTPTSGERKEISAQKADITRELLFIAHLCDRARIATLDEYQTIKGFSDHV